MEADVVYRLWSIQSGFAEPAPLPKQRVGCSEHAIAHHIRNTLVINSTALLNFGFLSKLTLAGGHASYRTYGARLFSRLQRNRLSMIEA
jgi:hypothetical protein